MIIHESLREMPGRFRGWQAIVIRGNDYFRYSDGEVRRMSAREAEKYGWVGSLIARDRERLIGEHRD